LRLDSAIYTSNAAGRLLKSWFDCDYYVSHLAVYGVLELADGGGWGVWEFVRRVGRVNAARTKTLLNNKRLCRRVFRFGLLRG